MEIFQKWKIFENYFVGKFVNGMREGNGKYKWPNGSVYTGNYLKDQMSGEGELKSLNGNVYVGAFVKGSRTGKGMLTKTNGTIEKVVLKMEYIWKNSMSITLQTQRSFMVQGYLLEIQLGNSCCLQCQFVIKLILLRTYVIKLGEVGKI